MFILIHLNLLIINALESTFAVLAERKRKLPQFAAFHESELSTKILTALKLYITSLIRSLRLSRQLAARRQSEQPDASLTTSSTSTSSATPASAETSTDSSRAYDKDMRDLLANCRESEDSTSGSLRAVAVYYSQVIAAYADYKSPKQEEMFFETFYEYVAQFCKKAVDAKSWKIVEFELNRLFRTDHFNITARESKTKQQRFLHAKDLYRLKYEVQRKPKPSESAGAIRAASHIDIYDAYFSTSPLVSTLLPEREDSKRFKKSLMERSPSPTERIAFGSSSAGRSGEDRGVSEVTRALLSLSSMPQGVSDDMLQSSRSVMSSSRSARDPMSSQNPS
jgi:hypothetical protein